MPQLSAPVQILSVQGKQIGTSRGPSTVYEVKASDGREYSTFKQPLAQKAHQAHEAGAAVLLSFEEKQKGQYTNYYLEDVLATDSSNTMDLLQRGVTPAPASAPLTSPPVAAQAPSSPIPVSSTSPDEKEARIARSVAIKAALDYQERVEDALILAPVIERYILTGQTGIDAPTQAPEPAQAGAPDEIPWD